MRKIQASLVLLALAVAACAPAGPTGYGPKIGVYGYSEEKLETGAWKVTFTGSDRTTREAVENYALYRAAKLSLEKGATRFAVIDRDFHHDVRRTSIFENQPPQFLPERDSMPTTVMGADAYERDRTFVTQRLIATVTIVPLTGGMERPAFPVEDANEVIRRLEPVIQRRGMR